MGGKSVWLRNKIPAVPDLRSSLNASQGATRPKQPGGRPATRLANDTDAQRCSTARATIGIVRQGRVGGFAHPAIENRGVWMLPCQNVSENPDFHNAFFILQAVDATGGNGTVQ